MLPHSSWKGFIQLSLVTIPVKAFTVHETEREVSLHQLHKDCNQRIKYQKVCPEHGELKPQDIIRGYEYTKDQYVVIEDEEIAKLRSENDHAVRIYGFVDAQSLDDLFLDGGNHFLLPDGDVGQKPYALFRDSMKENGEYALALVILTNREHLVVLRPRNKLIAMSSLYYRDQVKEEKEFEEYVKDVESAPGERELTKTLLAATTLKDFNLGSYKDDYRENILKLVDLKVEGKEIVAAEKPEEPKIVNLLDALKKSVEEAVNRQKAG